MRLKPGESSVHSVEGPQTNFIGWVQWAKAYDPALNMRVDVTLPTGEVLTFNDDLNAKQTFYIGDFGLGTLLIKVTNTGQKAVKYTIEYGGS